MSDKTDAISKAIDATTPDGLVWLPNPGHEPTIPDGWEFAGVRLDDGRETNNCHLLDWNWQARALIPHYAIRRKPAQPIRQQSGALVISGCLTAVGERFAGIESAGQQITLSINVEQARWLGRYVGGEVKLTVEVKL